MAEVRLTCVPSGSEYDTDADQEALRLMRRWTQILELHAGGISTRRIKNGRWRAGPPAL